MLTLLAVDSGISVHTAETAEAIAPASNVTTTNNFRSAFINFFICRPKTNDEDKIFGAIILL